MYTTITLGGVALRSKGTSFGILRHYTFNLKIFQKAEC